MTFGKIMFTHPLFHKGGWKTAKRVLISYNKCVLHAIVVIFKKNTVPKAIFKLQKFLLKNSLVVQSCSVHECIEETVSATCSETKWFVSICFVLSWSYLLAISSHLNIRNYS